MQNVRQDFDSLVRAVRAGSPDALRQLHDDYGRHVLLAVRARLPGQLRAIADSTDFTQDVWASFFTDVPAGDSLSTPEALIAYLTTMARNKVIDGFRRRTTQKHDIRRERPLDRDDRSDGAHAVAASGHTPSQFAIAEETWQQILRRVPAAYRAILVQARNGKSPEEIAGELNISSRTARRAIDRANELLADDLAAR